MNMNENSIRDRLVDHGQTLFQAPKQLIQFTKVPEANDLLNDLETHPHAFVLACVMDRQVKAEKAWIIPYRISEKLHGFSMDTLSPLSRADVKRLMTQPEPLHRFLDKMSECFHLVVQRISNEYAGNASAYGREDHPARKSSIVSSHSMALAQRSEVWLLTFLLENSKFPLRDYFSIDISADVHVRRVFTRLGLCIVNASVEQVIYKAKALHPEFPGMMDLPCWEIGRNWCKSRAPECAGCYMRDLCPTAVGGN